MGSLAPVKEEEKIAGSPASVLVQGDSKVVPVEELVLAKPVSGQLTGNSYLSFVPESLVHLARLDHKLGNFFLKIQLFAHN